MEANDSRQKVYRPARQTIHHAQQSNSNPEALLHAGSSKSCRCISSCDRCTGDMGPGNDDLEERLGPWVLHSLLAEVSCDAWQSQLSFQGLTCAEVDGLAKLSRKWEAVAGPPSTVPRAHCRNFFDSLSVTTSHTAPSCRLPFRCRRQRFSRACTSEALRCTAKSE